MTYLSHKSELNKNLRYQTSNNLNREIFSAVKDFEQNLAKNFSAKPFWHYMKSKRKVRSLTRPVIKSSNGTLTEDASECADVLSDYYGSVFVTKNLETIPFAVPKTYYDELVDMKFSDDLIACNRNFVFHLDQTIYLMLY